MTARNDGNNVNYDAAKRTLLQTVGIHHRVAEAHIENRRQAIEMALDFGCTWEELGQALGGITRQAAHKRFGDGRRIKSNPPPPPT